MKKIISLLYAVTLIIFSTNNIFAIDFNDTQTPEIPTITIPNLDNIIKNQNAGQQKYGFDGQEQTDCAKALLEYPSFNYLVTDFDLNIKINENNTYHVVEDYDVCYMKSNSHGIYRDIPTKNDFWRANGDITKDVLMQASNIKVDGDRYEKSSQNNNVHLKIGDPNKTLNHGDTKHYTISYDYNFGPDRLDGVDEFYYNLIGPEWSSDVVFLNTDFAINFPKDIEENKIGFTHGYTNDSLEGGTPFTLNNAKTIEGHYYDQLKGGEALTIRVTLPEGYIQNAKYDSNADLIIGFLIISAVITAIAVVLFMVYGKDEKLPLYAKNNPPEGMNPLQFGILTGANESTCVTSLFYYLAEQGYLKIEETNKKDFDIIFEKDYDGDDASAKAFIDALKKYDKDDSGRVNTKKLEDHFYTQIPKIVNASGAKEIRKQVYTKSGNTYQILTGLGLAVYLLASLGYLLSDPYLSDRALAFLALSAFFVAPGIFILLIGIQTLIKKQEIAAGIFMVIFGSLFGGLPGIMLFGLASEIQAYQLCELLIIFATSAIIGLCIKYGKHYTAEGRKIMTEVLSYYETIKNCQPDAEHGFSYFYYTFAFAFAAGLSTTFSKRFKDAISQPPDWYAGSSDFTHFDVDSFSASMNDMSSSSSSSPSSSDGGSGGGGSSGGGGGGGGGGGW